MSNPTPSISLSMIIRDAAATIESCLESVVCCAGGSAIDEIVLVDTGSEDDTRERVCAFLQAKARGYGAGGIVFPDEPGIIHSYTLAFAERNITLTLARFEWVDDFAAARQYSFDLASCDWRMYLDSDDTLPTAEYIRKTLARAIENDARCNVVSMVYHYAPNYFQDVKRLVRWADGWAWKDELHESLELPAGKQMALAVWKPMIVEHHTTHESSQKSLERNTRIAKKALEGARSRGDEAKIRFWSMYLGQYARTAGDLPGAAEYLDVASHGFGNIAALSCVYLSQVQLEMGRKVEAAHSAARASAALPEMREGVGQLALALLEDNPLNALPVFERFLAMPAQVANPADDRSFTEGTVLCGAAKALVLTGNPDRALQVLAKIPEGVREIPEITGLFRQLGESARLAKCLATFDEAIKQFRESAYASAPGVKQIGLYLTKALVEYYVWDCEPVKALALLNNPPSAIATAPELNTLRRALNHQLRHLDSWEEYKKCYSEIPDEQFHTASIHAENVRRLGRAQATRKWAQELPQAGAPLYVCSIGTQDAIIERDVLDANPRIHMVVCDVAPQAGELLEKMITDYPGRVRRHFVEKHHYDWPKGWDRVADGSIEKFDAIFIFEVIEHLPSDMTAFAAIYERLSPAGELFLSTPIADRWVESYLTDPRDRPAFYGHVRAFTPDTLHVNLATAGLTGDIVGTDNGALFLARAKKSPIFNTPQQNIVFFAPDAYAPFDPLSLKSGHCGGSEEALIYLSRELAALGHDVTVFAPMPVRDGADVLYTVDGVRWRPAKDFAPDDETQGSLVLWRCPQMTQDPRMKLSKRKVFNWAHDAFYGAGAECYESPIKTIALSKSHGESLIEGDGAKNIVYATNGIDPAMFPEPDETQRAPHKCIYASSPDRGLEKLLDGWPDVRAAVPDATLDIYYDWTGFRNRFPAWAAKLTTRIAELEPSGVTFIGGVDHATLHAAYRKAAVWAYPYSGAKIETSCISAMKAMASGCMPLVIGLDALPETLGAWGMQTPPEENYGKLLGALLQQPLSDSRADMRKSALDRFSWATVAKRFVEIFTA